MSLSLLRGVIGGLFQEKFNSIRIQGTSWSCIVWLLDLQLPMQLVHITTNIEFESR